MSLDFVSFIHASFVSVHVETLFLRERILDIGGTSSEKFEMVISYSCEKELSIIISMLQSLAIPFSDQEAGWPPAAVFDFLKEKNMVSGSIRRISWRNTDTWVIS